MTPAGRIPSPPLSLRAVDSPMRPARAMNEPAAAGRALVVAARTPQAEPPRPRAVDRNRAPFLAHLVATKQGAPQTRMRRRAAPDEALAAYAATTRRWAGAPATLAYVA